MSKGKYFLLGGDDDRLIVALEGLPCAGKSTFMNMLKRSRIDFLCVPELYIKVRKGASVVLARKRYAAAEIMKKRKADLTGDKDLLLDRSFLSTLAFSYAKSKTFGDDSDYLYNRKFLMDNRKNILSPNFVLVFDITPEESLRRRKGLIRDDTLDVWRNKIFLQHFKDFYSSNDIEEIVGKNRIVFVDSMGMSIFETYEFALEKLRNYRDRHNARSYQFLRGEVIMSP